MKNIKKLFIVSLAFISFNTFASEAELQTQIDQLKQEIKSHAPSDTIIGGYGEINYNAYSNDSSKSQMDLRRFVLSVTKNFNSKLSFNGEMEWEHSVVSSGDKGEAAIEQAYINYQISEDLSVKAGLFLMPFGFLNESHEPPVFYGVERNEVEQRIIPTTWREGGVGITGTTSTNLDWGLGLVTGFDIAKFDAAGEPLGSIHQELQFAKARDLSLYATLNYKVPGLVAGVAAFTGDSTQGNADYKANTSLPDFSSVHGRITLADVHVRWQPSAWDLQVLLAKGGFSDAESINQVLLAYNTTTAGSRPYVASEFYGWLVQAAYKFSLSGESSVSPFARFEEYDTQAAMPSGFTASPANADHVLTVGASYKPVAQVVFKTDFQNFKEDSTQNRFNLGLGYMF